MPPVAVPTVPQSGAATTSSTATVADVRDGGAPLVTRVELDLGSGQIRRGALLGAQAVVQRHSPTGWVPCQGAEVRLTFTPLDGGDVVILESRSDERGRARFAARHNSSGTWSAQVLCEHGTPSSAARLVLVHD